MMRPKAKTILMGGAHPLIRQGSQLFLNDLIENNLIHHVATNGAAAFHDWELSVLGKACEPVEDYIREGKFGMWEELTQFNDLFDILQKETQLNLGDTLGRALQHYPESIFGCCYSNDVRSTVHLGIGFDVFQMYKNFTGAHLIASYNDFLSLVGAIEDTTTVLCFGSQVTAPMVFEKAFSMHLAAGGELPSLVALISDSTENPNDYFYRPKKVFDRITNKHCYYECHNDPIMKLWEAVQNAK
jgi:hypothetical protein